MEKQLKPILQRPQDLILAVTTHDVLPQTDTLVTRCISVGAWQAQFCIIGESHRVRITHNDDFILEEMLACIDLPHEPLIYQNAFELLQAHTYQQSAYQVSVDFSHQEQHWRIASQEIAYHFPQIDSHHPITRIQWHTTDSAFHWRTLHTYRVESLVHYIYSESHYIIHTEDTP